MTPEQLQRRIEAAAEAMEDAAVRLLGRDLGTVHRNDIARAALEAADAVVPVVSEAHFQSCEESAKGVWQREHESSEESAAQLKQLTYALFRSNIDWITAAQTCGDARCEGDCVHVATIRRIVREVDGGVLGRPLGANDV